MKAEHRRPRRGNLRSQKGTDEAKNTNIQAATGRVRGQEKQRPMQRSKLFTTNLTITQWPAGKDVQTHI